MGVSRQSFIDLKRNIEGIDPKVLQDAFLLSKKITRELQLKKINDSSIAPTIFFSKEQALQIIQDFYQSIDSDMANIVGSIIENNNPDFSLLLYQSNLSPKLPQSACITDEIDYVEGTKANTICLPMEKDKFSVEELIELAHEFSHAVAMTYHCSRDANGKIQISSISNNHGFVYGETESKTCEMLFSNYLSERFPQCKKEVDSHVRNTIVAGIPSSALESYLKLGIALTDLDEHTEGELDSEDYDKIGAVLGTSGDKLEERLSHMSKDGKLNSKIPFKYCYGGLLAIYMNQHSNPTCLKDFFRSIKNKNMKESLRNVGLDSEGLSSEQLCTSLEECYSNLDNNTIEIENGER